jgi:hypothetical protein
MAISGRDMAMQAPGGPASLSQDAGLLERYAPAWALRAAAEVRGMPSSQRTLILVAAVLFFALGFVFAVGGGYWSIQGLREFLNWAGVRVQLAGRPAPQWWLIPIANTYIQIAARRVDALRRVLWRPSVWFGATTTSGFLAIMLDERMAAAPIWTIALLSATIGLVLEIVVEHILIGMAVVILAAWKR